MLTRRRLMLAAASLPLVPRAIAQAGTTRLVVGFPPGGVVDVTGRALADALRAGLQGSVIVENRPGAGGRIGVEAVKAAAPDGTTLLYTPPSMFTVYPHIDPALRYDVFADFIPVGTVCSYPFALAVSAGLPATTLPGFLAWAKANPKDAAYGTPGTGTIQSFIGAMLAKTTGVPLVHVPYKGGAQSINDLLAGTIASTIAVAQSYTAHHKAGKLRVLAVSGARRLDSLPDVPTFAELGYPTLTFEEWFGVFVPARTPADTVARLSRALAAAIAAPAMNAVLQKLDYAPLVTEPARFAALLREDYERWGAIVKETGFKPS